MEELAKELQQKINWMCIGYYYYKHTDVVERGRKLSDKIREFSSIFLQGNIFGIEEEEYIGLKNYTMEVLKDYMQSIEQQDMVLMIDTLDFGFRELLEIFVEPDAGEETNE